ncbi:MAG: hypothetical protein IJ800_00865, partial [Clostridia bacterium]|nr:hypothetical protein [Clostridia bacterium]
AYAEKSYEEGKKGVVVSVVPAKSGDMVDTNLGNGGVDVAITEKVNYNDLVNRGLLYDLTEVIGSGAGSLKAKLAPDYESFLNTDGKYYALPLFMNSYGLIYDVDLFEENHFYLKAGYTTTYAAAKNSKGEYVFIESYSETKSAGPDGVHGTADDGLPATYEQFFALLDEITEMGFIPVTWTGQYQMYFTRFLYSVWANNEGFDQMKLNYTFSGTANNIVTGYNGEQPIFEQKTIDDTNGYLLNASRGKYYALKFAEQLIGNRKYYTNSSMQSDTSNSDAQYVFLEGDGSDNTSVAMLVEGQHWENEVKDAGILKNTDSIGRRFATLPLPNVSDADIGNSKNFLYDMSGSMFLVNSAVKDSVREEAVCDFVKFFHTDEEMAYFTKNTSLVRPFDYTIGASVLNDMTYFGQTNYQNLRNALADGKVFVAASNHKVFLSNYKQFTPQDSNVFSATVNGHAYTEPSNALRLAQNGEHTVSALDYFKAMVDEHGADWWSRLSGTK